MNKIIGYFTVFIIILLASIPIYLLIDSALAIINNESAKKDFGIIFIVPLALLIFFILVLKLRREECGYEGLKLIPYNEFTVMQDTCMAPNQFEIEEKIKAWISRIKNNKSCHKIVCEIDEDEPLLCSSIYFLVDVPVDELRGKRGIISDIEAEVVSLSKRKKRTINSNLKTDTKFIYHVVWD